MAAAFVHHTGQHLFLTGKAGTGKTTFLKYIRENAFKKMAVVAPTGVAAINAGGVTMHSFFQLPFGVYLPTRDFVPADTGGEVTNETMLLRNIRFSSSKRELLQELELLVIDEVSMLRADMLDAMDLILRHYRRFSHLPFGGVQVLYVGDLFQLPPVVNNREWQVLKEYYKSPFFFDAQVMQKAPPVSIELQKIYRQNDPRFIHILNHVRNNVTTAEDLEELHRRYEPGFVPSQDEHFITLCSHNQKANAINRNALQQLPGKACRFEGKVKGDFNEKAFPAEQMLELKEGAQIMFIKNDKGEVRRFFNGKIGIVSRIEGEQIFIRFPGEADELELEQETWTNIRYSYDKEKDNIDEEELGSYTQYPIRLAWAISIHKSQGLTFEKAIIDAGESFAAGQVYVALSRLTSLDGMVLRSRILQHCIRTDQRVLEFAAQTYEEDSLELLLQAEQKKFVEQSLVHTFDWSKLVHTLQQHLEQYEHRQIHEKGAAMRWAEALLKKGEEQQAVANRFATQLEKILATAKADNYAHLHDRIEAATTYFAKAIHELIEEVEQHRREWEKKAKTKKYIKDLAVLKTVLQRKKLQIQQTVHVTTGLAKGMDAASLLHIVEQQKKENALISQEVAVKSKSEARVPKGYTRTITLQLFRQGKTIEAIAGERGLAISTIEAHLSEFVATGEVAIRDLVPEEKMQAIMEAIEKATAPGLSAIRQQLNDSYSFGEIRAVLQYRDLLQAEKAAT